MFRSSFLVAVAGFFSGVASGLTHFIGSPQFASCLASLIAACGVAIIDTFVRFYLGDKPSRSKRTRKPRAIPPDQPTKSPDNGAT